MFKLVSQLVIYNMCCTAFKTIHDWVAMSDREKKKKGGRGRGEVDTVCLDLKKVFNEFPHRRLLIT